MGILRQALTGDYRPHGIESEASVILAYSFGRGNDTPGLVNEALADYAIQKSQEHNIGIVAQLAVADAIEQHDIQGLPLIRIDPRNAREAHYMHTGHILERVSGYIEPTETVMVVAQAYHAPRADRQTVAAGYQTVLPEALPTDWDPNSIFQEMHCRTPLIWAVREPLVLAGYQLTGRFRPCAP